jgi:hypothetical protein
VGVKDNVEMSHWALFLHLLYIVRNDVFSLFMDLDIRHMATLLGPEAHTCALHFIYISRFVFLVITRVAIFSF